MSYIDDINVVAGMAKSQYALYASALAGLLLQTLSQENDPTSARARRHFDAKIKEATRAQYDSMTREIGANFEKLVEAGITDAKAKVVAKDVREYGNELFEELRGSLVACITKDAATVLAKMRKVSLEVGFRGDKVGMVTALIKARHEASQSLTFVQKDSLGRSYGSTGFVYSLVRWYCLMAYIESKLYGLSKTGIDLVKVVSPGGGQDGEIISISGATEGYRTYFEVKDSLFYPLSNADLVPL